FSRDWSSDVCSSDLGVAGEQGRGREGLAEQLGHRGAVVVAATYLGPCRVEVHAHPANPGVGQQEPGEDVVVVQWLAHVDNGPVGSNRFNGGGNAMGQPGKARRRRRWLHWLWRLPLLFVALTALQVLVLRFVDPPFSAFMVARQLEAVGQGDWGHRSAYDWRDLDAMAPSLPLALVAAEDQRFPE